jgi:hypothetical protein
MKKDYVLRFAMLSLHTIYLLAVLPIVVLQTIFRWNAELLNSLFHHYFRHWRILAKMFFKQQEPNSYANYYQHVSFK